MPMTPFIGVRISWLMLARKLPSARVAALASSRAWQRVASNCRRAGRASEESDPAVGVEQGLPPGDDPPVHAVATGHLELDLVGLAGRQGLFHRGVGQGQALGREEARVLGVGRRREVRVVPGDPVELVGPGDDVEGGVPLPAPDAG